MDDLAKKGSEIAKNGFKNEKEIAYKFNNWQNDKDALRWLEIMNYDISLIEWVKATVINGYKSDLNVKVQIKSKNIFDIENIQIKLVSNKKGFNQIDKRWVKRYSELWDIPEDVVNLLRYFTGEQKPYRSDTRDCRRMFINEFTENEQKRLVSWFENNKTLILSDIIRGRGEFAAEWVLVVRKFGSENNWVLKNINEVLGYYSQGEVSISKKGSLNIGHVTMQRKGGDGGRKTANMLQFKADPTELFD